MSPKRVCIVDTIYTLFLYLLISSEEEYAQTFFFVGDGIPKSIKKNLTNCYSFEGCNSVNKRRKLRLYLNLTAKFKWPFLSKAQIFAQDHLLFAPGLIGKRDYVFLEDAPLIASRHYNANKKRMSFVQKRRVSDLFYGSLFANFMAANRQCKEVIFTVDDYAPFLDGKKINIFPIDELWNQADERKRNLILSIYNVTQEDLSVIQTKSKILFTQPFFADHLMSEEEQMGIYKEIISKYDEREIVIKTHPRDLLNYSEIFPKALVFDKPIPMQLFNFLGVRFERAITVFSTAVFAFPYEIEIDWIGTKIHKNLLAEFGDIELPKNNK